ncbi:cbb3-type cytochrome c oxidase subunit I, partial [Brucella grignonensis]
LAIASGWTDGEEWLEIPWQLDMVLALAGVFFVIPLVKTAIARQVHHIYVSGWYFLAGILWFPCLFVIANIPYIHSGVEEATVNWWFAHNVLGLWLTPLGVGTAYYFIPKIIGKPIYSYSVSLLGFWGLALFYSQVGIHHLIGGPVPTWVVTLSIVHSVMMFIPVIAVAINQHVTVARNLWALKESLPLRFISFGAVMYTLASFQGSIEALRSVNTVTHFTHYTVGHAHLGAYAFVTIVMFGAAYHMLPRMTGRTFQWPALINAHFWLVVVGFAIYFFGLSIGGVLQGLAMLDATRPFADSVTVTIPYLEARSVGGSLMTLGHVLFAVNVVMILFPRPASAAAKVAPAE